MSSLRTGRRMHGLRQRGSMSGKHLESSGPTRVHRYVSDPGPEPKTMDDSKPTANWGRSVQSIHEEVGTGGQCGM